MALWKSDIKDEMFDDGLSSKPGEESFTREVAEKQFGHKKFSYVGTPNWVAPEQPADESAQ